jgi:hypothetical protein
VRSRSNPATHAIDPKQGWIAAVKLEQQFAAPAYKRGWAAVAAADGRSADAGVTPSLAGAVR